MGGAVCGGPGGRQELAEFTRTVNGQAFDEILEIGLRIDSMIPNADEQGGNHGGTLAGFGAAYEQPVLFSPIVAAHSRQVWRIDAAFVPADDRVRVDGCVDAWSLGMSWDRLSQLQVIRALPAFMLRCITQCSERIYLSLSIRASPPDPGTRRVT